MFGVTKERVRQIEIEALDKLKLPKAAGRLVGFLDFSRYFSPFLVFIIAWASQTSLFSKPRKPPPAPVPLGPGENRQAARAAWLSCPR